MEGFPDVISRTVIRTGPISEMMITVYKTEEFAEKARLLANKSLKKHEEHPYEVLDFHGEVLHQEQTALIISKI